MEKRYRGLCYPLSKSPDGIFHNTDDLFQLKSDMATIILTKPGERVMQPDFGTNFSRINYNQPTELVINELRQIVARSLKKWEKRIQVTDVMINLFVTEENEVTLQMKILFIDPIDLNTIQELNIEKVLGEYDGRNMPF